MGQTNDVDLPTEIWRAPVTQPVTPVRKVARTGSSMAALRQAALAELAVPRRQGEVPPLAPPSVVTTAVRDVVSGRAGQDVSEASALEEAATEKDEPMRDVDAGGQAALRSPDAPDGERRTAPASSFGDDDLFIDVGDVQEAPAASPSREERGVISSGNPTEPSPWLIDDDSDATSISYEVDVEDAGTPAPAEPVAARTTQSDLDLMIGDLEEENAPLPAPALQADADDEDAPSRHSETAAIDSEEAALLGIGDGWVEDEDLPAIPMFSVNTPPAVVNRSSTLEDGSEDGTDPGKEGAADGNDDDLPDDSDLPEAALPPPLAWIKDETPVGGLGLIAETAAALPAAAPPQRREDDQAMLRGDVDPEQASPGVEQVSEVVPNASDAPAEDGETTVPVEDGDPTKTTIASDHDESEPSSPRDLDPHVYDLERLKSALTVHRRGAVAVLRPHVAPAVVRSRTLAHFKNAAWTTLNGEIAEMKETIADIEARLTTGLPTFPVIGGIFARKIEHQVVAAQQSLAQLKKRRAALAQKFLNSQTGRKISQAMTARALRQVDADRVPAGERQTVISAKAILAHVDEIEAGLRQHPLAPGETVIIAAMPEESRFLSLAASSLRWRLK